MWLRELQKILLRWLDRILNPNLHSKLTWALFLLGSSLVASAAASSYLVKAELEYKWIKILATTADDNSFAFLVIGALFVLLSVFLLFSSPSRHDFRIPGQRITVTLYYLHHFSVGIC
ncbi:MAG: hypothetical protein N838_34215 [Thiohalocapsa sp. PB-PSB1]|jgi:hypothetical protein|nr:MAG: hypothetical protein N838_34215 [Thiohalocapsa sp. PB-PSB1]